MAVGSTSFYAESSQGCVDAVARLERLGASGVIGPQWRSNVHDSLDLLRNALRVNAPQPAFGSGSTGQSWTQPYVEVSQDAPRLQGALRRLGSERERLAADLDLLQARSAYGEPGSLGKAVRQLVADVRRHQRHVADVLYQAYVVDIGGEM